MTEKKLKPCPFCGGRADASYACGSYEAYCTNKKCHAARWPKHLKTEKGVTDRWNKRAQ